MSAFAIEDGRLPHLFHLCARLDGLWGSGGLAGWSRPVDRDVTVVVRRASGARRRLTTMKIGAFRGGIVFACVGCMNRVLHVRSGWRRRNPWGMTSQAPSLCESSMKPTAGMRMSVDGRKMRLGWMIRAMLFGLTVTGCSSPTSFDDLKRPTLIWERSRGLCGGGLALDGDGRLWADEGGCEDGATTLSARGLGAPEKVEALRQAFDALPPNSGPDRLACSGKLDSFSKRSDAGGFDSSACASGTGTDLTGLEEPYFTAAQRFLALP